MADRPNRPFKTVLRLLLVTSVLALVVTAGLIGTAGADITSGSQIDAITPINPDPTSGQAITPGTPFSSGQIISVSAPANTVLIPNQNVVLEECAAPNGVLPTQPDQCDSNTLSAQTIIPNPTTGAFTYSNYSVYALPDLVSLGESSDNPVTCSDTPATECVLGIFDNPENFSSPDLFSQTFDVVPSPGDDAANPGDGSAPAAATAPSASLSTVSASRTSAVADGVDSSTITVTLNGENSSNTTVPIPGAPVTLTANSGTNSTIATSPATTSSAGVVTFTVTDSTAEAVTYTASSGSTTVTRTAQVTFEAPAVSPLNSTVTVSSTTVPNGGTSTITVSARDQGAAPQPMADQTVSLAANSGTSSMITPSSATTGSSGVATFTVSDPSVEPVTYTATVGGVTLTQTVQVTFGSLVVSPSVSTVVARSSTAAAGGAGTTIAVTLLTATGQPVPGKNVVLTPTSPSSNTAIVAQNTGVVTGTNGDAVFGVSDAADETVTFSATDQTDGLTITATANVAFGSAAVSPTLSTVTFESSDPPALTTPADGTSAFNVFVTIENTVPVPVAGDAVSLTPSAADQTVVVTPDSPPSGSSTPDTSITSSVGVAEFQVRDTAAESVTFTVEDTTAGVTISPPTPVTLTFTAGSVDGSVSTVAASPAAVAADGKTASTVTVTLEDHFNNPVAGKTVTLDQGSGHSVISPATATTNPAGIATFSVADTTNEDVTYIAVDDSDQDLALFQTAQVAFGTPPPDVPVPNDSAIVSNYSAVPADGKTAATLSVLLYDANGLPVSGRTVALAASGGSSVISPPTQMSSQDGVATFSVTDATPQTVTYTAQDTTDDVAVSGSVAVTFTVPSSPSSSTGHLNSPIVGVAATPDGGGYWLVASDGGVFSYGDAHFHGSAGGVRLNKPVVGVATTPDGGGYWLVASDGGVLTYGDAHFYGSAGGLHLNSPIVGMAATPDGGGYWLVASDGGVFSYGDAHFHGSAGGLRLNQPVVGMAATPDGGGYWLVASDGGIFRYGDASYDGSTGGLHLNKPVVGMAATPDGGGYWLVASDGGIFTFGDAGFHGSTGSLHLNGPIVGMAPALNGTGYWLVGSDGGVFGGDAHFYGSAA
jgi:hypothetical protein